MGHPSRRWSRTAPGALAGGLAVGDTPIGTSAAWSLGSQSEEGEQRIARLLSAHTTRRLQGRSLHAYLIDLLAAHARGDPPPLLA